jgi:hypothetical protein
MRLPRINANSNDRRESSMNTRRALLGVAAVLVLGVGWYLFRPERLFVNQTVNEGLATAQAAMSPELVASGSFKTGAHETHGKALVYRRADGTRVLRLMDFETSNGPDVQVYLVAADDVTDNDVVKRAGFVNLGALKGNVGDQNYEIPMEVDLERYRTATIWCRRFGVNFGSAPLMMTMGDMPEMTETMPTGAPKALASGRFHPVAHEGRGTATVYELADGRRVLRFTDFATSNGPDVQVYLVAAADAMDSDIVKSAGFIHLAALKGNLGDQNYDLPADVDLSKYRSVTIWCRRFGVNFATAPLMTVS